MKKSLAIVVASVLVLAFGCKGRDWNPVGSSSGGGGLANISGTYIANIPSCNSATKLVCTISYQYTDSSTSFQYYSGTLSEYLSNGSLCSSETLLVTYVQSGSQIENFLPSGVGCISSFGNLSTLTASSTEFSGQFMGICSGVAVYPVWTFVKQ